MAPMPDDPGTRDPQRWDGPLPKTTVKAVDILLELIPVEEQRRIAATPEEDFRVLAHFALGLWVRNHFIHPGNPELCAACQTDHPDQVSAAILDVLWERLQDDPGGKHSLETAGRQRRRSSVTYAQETSANQRRQYVL